MEKIICPNCQTENPVNALVCSGCNQNLRMQEPAFKSISETWALQPGSSAQSQESPSDGAEKQELLPLPETPAEPGQETPAASKGTVLPEPFAASASYWSAAAAAGAYASDYLADRLGEERVMLRKDARKKIICAVILAAVVFLALSLRMLYHRNNILAYLVVAACGICFWKIVLKDNTARLLGEKLASMPKTEMESILMSEIDQTVSMRKIRALCLGIVAASVLPVLVLFWTPHMIFEKTDGVVSLRFYTDSVVKEKDVVIPDTWNGEPVTQIRGNVFENVAWIQSVRLPAGLKVIRAHAFMGCRSLEEVVFPKTMREIGSSAFRRCPSLRSVTLPRGCSVNQKAFKESPTKISYFSGD